MTLLRIVSINDVYALDNLARFATLVATARTGCDRLLVVLAGDFLAPSLLSSLDEGRGMVECMNAVGITHVVLGNHEDDIETAALAKRIRELRAICLGTNVSAFDPPLPRFDVVEVRARSKRVRVGIVGAVMDDANAYRRPPFGRAHLEAPNPALLDETARLVLEEGCACVVPITHQTMAADRALATAAQEGDAPMPYPVILGGHEHVVIEESVGTTRIVKTGSDAVHAAIVELSFDDEGKLATTTVRVVATADHDENAAVRVLVDRHLAPVRELESIPLVRLAPGVELSSVGTRRMQTSMGTFVCSHLRDAMAAQGCLYNGGGIRGNRVHTGALTYGALRTEMPFDNAVVVVRLPGHVIRDTVAASRAQAPKESGGFLQVDDEMTVDEHGLVTAIARKPLDPTAEYRIAIVHTLFGGLDRIEPLLAFANEHPELVPHADTGRETKLVLLECLALTRWKQLGAFSALDGDHDGKVTRDEVAAALEKEASPAVAAATARILVDAIDVDHDGVITEDEARRLRRPST